MASTGIEQDMPHAVCVTYPAQGHINPNSRDPDSLKNLSSFCFETIPHGLPPGDTDATREVASLCESTDATCLGPFKELLAKLNDTCSSKVPPFSCIVSDGSTSFTLVAAQELGVPLVSFLTFATCATLKLHALPQPYESYLTNRYLETTTLDWIPDMKDMRLRDLPSFLRTANPDDFMLKYVIQETERVRYASAIVVNTFEPSENEVLESLQTLLPPVYVIGPLHLLVKHVDDKNLEDLGSNLWKEEPKCLEWLNSKKPYSVVYVNFGSIAVMSQNHLIKFAWDYKACIVLGEQAVLPPEFVEETKERGMLASWCQQEQVLNHPTIGGFLTHSGWNSTLESISSGVPIICWPFVAEQPTNCWFCCTKLGIGMEINNNVKRDEIEVFLRELMIGEKGKEMKKRVLKWKKLAEEAAKKPTGSSYEHIQTDQ
ncbi:unnamed protein product [Withania somnifera]